MSSVNKVILIGNLGKDPEVRTTQNDTRVANLSVATAERWRDKNSGEKRERTEWHRVVVWGKLAEIAEKYLAKGSKVYLEGKLQTRKWQDQNGSDRYTTEVVLQGYNAQLTMLDSAQKRDTGGNRDDDFDSGSQGSGGPGPGGFGSDLDDEIPFAPLRELP